MNQRKCVFDYSKLRGKIVEKYGTQTKFADAYGVSRQTMSLKLNNHISFTSSDVVNIANLLDITANEINSYFFTEKV